MQDARGYIEPGDLCAIVYSYFTRAGVAFKWTEKSFQYFSIKDAKRKVRMYSSRVDNIEEYFSNIWNPYKNYIYGTRMNQRVIPITRDCLTEGELKYYDTLKDNYE